MQCCKKLKLAYDHETINPSSQFWEQALQYNHLLLYSFFVLEVNRKKLVYTIIV
jgi:hypothetical protein